MPTNPTAPLSVLVITDGLQGDLVTVLNRNTGESKRGIFNSAKEVLIQLENSSEGDVIEATASGTKSATSTATTLKGCGVEITLTTVSNTTTNTGALEL